MKIFKAFFCAILLSFLFSANFSYAAQALNKVVAIVNDDIITQNELDQTMMGIKAQMAQHHQPVPADFRKKVLDQLIAQKLQLQIAKRANVTVSNAELNSTVAHIAQSNHLTIAQLKQKLVSSGGTYSEFIDNIKQQIILTKLQRQAMMQEVKVSDAEINAAMREIHEKMRAAQQIQVLDVVVPANSQKDLSRLKTDLQKNIPNSEISKQFPAVSFNDMGWQNASTLPELFVHALQNAKSHQIVGPIQAPNGFHFLKITNTRSGPTQNITRDQAKMYAMQKKSQVALQKWIEKLRKTAYVKIVS